MQEQTREVLKRARELISDENNWCKGALSRDKNGEDVWVSTEHACSWCASGAIIYAAKELGVSEKGRISIMDMMKIFIGRHQFLSQFNDNSTHAEVLAAFDRALEA